MQSPPRIDTRRTASIIVVCGSSGSGKSAWVKQRISNDRRVIVFDQDDEYSAHGLTRIDNRIELIDWLQANKKGRACYVANGAEAFGFWCRAAFAWGNCTAVAEELAGVTSPGKAPHAWHVLVSRGRKRAIKIYGITQRPSESDKTIMGNASLIHVGRLSRDQDRRYMAREINVTPGDIEKLRPLEWIESDGTGKIKRGSVTF